MHLSVFRNSTNVEKLFCESLGDGTQRQSLFLELDDKVVGEALFAGQEGEVRLARANWQSGGWASRQRRAT